jgi:hypothetical protein
MNLIWWTTTHYRLEAVHAGSIWIITPLCLKINRAYIIHFGYETSQLNYMPHIDVVELSNSDQFSFISQCKNRSYPKLLQNLKAM